MPTWLLAPILKFPCVSYSFISLLDERLKRADRRDTTRDPRGRAATLLVFASNAEVLCLLWLLLLLLKALPEAAAGLGGAQHSLAAGNAAVGPAGCVVPWPLACMLRGAEGTPRDAAVPLTAVAGAAAALPDTLFRLCFTAVSAAAAKTAPIAALPSSSAVTE